MVGTRYPTFIDSESMRLRSCDEFGVTSVSLFFKFLESLIVLIVGSVLRITSTTTWVSDPWFVVFLDSKRLSRLIHAL